MSRLRQTTGNHWSNEQKVMEYIKNVIIPYVQQKRKDLKLPPGQAALAPFDVFKGQQTEEVAALLEDNHIVAVPIPANCTDRLQLMDLSINKAVHAKQIQGMVCHRSTKAVERWSDTGITCRPQNVHHEATWRSMACKPL
jgi:hypothetical protein